MTEDDKLHGSIPEFYVSLIFILNSILICYPCSQTSELCHIFK